MTLFQQFYVDNRTVGHGFDLDCVVDFFGGGVLLEEPFSDVAVF